MGTEEIKKLPLEERLVAAVVNFANSRKGWYKIEKMLGRNQDLAYGECLSISVNTNSGSFLAGIKINEDGELILPVFTTTTPIKKELYKEFCEYLESLDIQSKPYVTPAM